MGMSYWREKVVVVTGGSSGLGRAIAEAFADRGAKLVVAALEAEDVARSAAALRRSGTEVLGVAADVTCQADVERMFRETLDRFGHLDVLVNCAGRSARGKVLDTTPEQFQSLMELNFLGLVRCARAAVPYLLERRGHLVNIGSLAAKAAARWLGAYPVSKFAVAAYSQQLRLELGADGLHVLLVCPGPIARKEPRLYPLEGLEELPETARRAGAGVKSSAIDPARLARLILRACEQRKAELVVPARARVLFALAQLWPRLGDWLILKFTSAAER
jgi:NAD(P)-dependent dehydrogenase (short-subunit alcohol dehydrogenase family)